MPNSTKRPANDVPTLEAHVHRLKKENKSLGSRCSVLAQTVSELSFAVVEVELLKKKIEVLENPDPVATRVTQVQRDMVR